MDNLVERISVDGEAVAKVLWGRRDNDYTWDQALCEPELAEEVEWTRQTAVAVIGALRPETDQTDRLVARLRAGHSLADHWAGKSEELCREAADALASQAALIAELQGEVERLTRSEGDMRLRYDIWRGIYGAMIAVEGLTTPEAKVVRQAHIISCQAHRLKNLRREIRRHLKADPVDNNKWFNGPEVYAYGRRHFEASVVANEHLAAIIRAYDANSGAEPSVSVLARAVDEARFRSQRRHEQWQVS